jgi:L-iditol 2-dehydrogenase
VDEAVDVSAGAAAERFARQYDLVIDGLGTGDSVNLALDACVRGGRIVVYGVPTGDITYPLKAAFAKDVTLVTSRLYDADFGPATALVASGQVRLRELITHRVDLAGAARLLPRVLAGAESAIKIMVSP